MSYHREALPHGGDWAGYQAEYGTPPLDFSANGSPLGPPAGVVEAVTAAARTADRYPDPLCRALTAALAAREEIPEPWILCGNGAADLIYRVVLALRPQCALVAVPGFAEYENALTLAGCALRQVALSPQRDFRMGEDFLTAITPELDMVFLCEPHNPTGLTNPLSFLERVLERCTRVGAFLVVDACFEDFLPAPQTRLLKAALASHQNLLMLKAFTKFYGMAGIRLGYALTSNRRLLARMRGGGQPWAVSSLAQAAGIAALQEQTYGRQVRELVQRERPWLQHELQALGCRVIPGEANYLLFQHPAPLLEPLRERGILLRSCSNYAGLDESWYRTAVRRHEENRKLLKAIKEIVTG